CAALRRQLLDKHRHADGAASADAADADLRRQRSAREIRLSDEAAHSDQARLQEPETHRRYHGDERISRRLLGKPGLQLVRRIRIAWRRPLQSHHINGVPMSIRFKLATSLVALTLASASFAQSPAAKPERIRGDIVSFSGNTLTVHRRS